MKVTVIQPLLPKYSIAFFNRLVELYPDLELTLLADIKTQNSLNQYVPQDCQFQVVHLSNKEKGGLAYRPGLFTLLSKYESDIIVFSGTPRDLSQFFGLFLCKLLGKKAVAWGMFHRIGGPRLISNFYYKFAGFFAAKCLTYTRTGALNLLSLGVPKYKIGIVGTAIDERIPLAQKAARTPEELSNFRQYNGLEGKYVVLQVVRLSRIKRPEYLVLAAENLLKERDDIVFALIGEGEMKNELQQMVVERGMQNAFRFLGGIYDEEQLSYWYMNANVFVVPKCIGLSAHHAMCYGVPVVTDDSLDCQASEFEILSNGLNSFLYREDDIGSLASTISKVLDTEKSNFFNQSCMMTIKINSLDEKAKNFMSILSSIVKANKFIS